MQLESRREPAASFTDALQALVPDLLELCELPSRDSDRVTVTSVSLSWTPNRQDDGAFIMGATLVGVRTLSRSSCPLNLVTPHKFETYTSGGDTGDDRQLLDGITCSRIERVIREAESYLAGASAPSAQPSLFEEEPVGVQVGEIITPENVNRISAELQEHLRQRPGYEDTQVEIEVLSHA